MVFYYIAMTDRQTYRKQFTVNSLSERSPWKIPVQGGGALNADYTQSEALANLCNKLGQHGLVYGKDFYWEDTFLDKITLVFNRKEDIIIANLKL